MGERGVYDPGGDIDESEYPERQAAVAKQRIPGPLHHAVTCAQNATTLTKAIHSKMGSISTSSKTKAEELFKNLERVYNVRRLYLRVFEDKLNNDLPDDEWCRIQCIFATSLPVEKRWKRERATKPDKEVMKLSDYEIHLR